MADSRRINANIREEDEKRPAEEQPPFGVYAVILSSEFWPPFKDEKLEVPEDIREALEVYCKKYEKLKVPRTPPWVGNEAQVTLPAPLCSSSWVQPLPTVLPRAPCLCVRQGWGVGGWSMSCSLRDPCTCAHGCPPQVLTEGLRGLCPPTLLGFLFRCIPSGISEPAAGVPGSSQEKSGSSVCSLAVCLRALSSYPGGI